MHIARAYTVDRSYRYIRTAKFRIWPDGRWGPRWLHRLVFRAAMNLGMIRHLIDEEPIYDRRPVIEPKVIDSIRRQVLGWLEQNFNRNDLAVFVGHEAAYILYAEMSEEFWRQDHSGHRHQRVLGIPMIVMPQMEGALVVPISLVRPKSDSYLDVLGMGK